MSDINNSQLRPAIKKKLIIGGGIAIALIVVLVSIYGYINGLRNTSIDFETRMSATYQANQVELDSYVKSVTEAVGVANLKSAKLNQIFADAVRGRYGDSRDEIKNGQGGQFMSAVVEAYPDLKGQLDVYDRIVERVFAGREAFKQRQFYLRDNIRAYEHWLNSGLVQSWVIKNVVGAPTELLEARIGNNVRYGREALSQMKVQVTSKSTSDAFESGEEEGLGTQLPPGSKK